MPNFSKSKNSLWFLPASLSKGKEWIVMYWVENPANGNKVRKRVKINRIKSIAERGKYAKKIIHEINEKLYSGWNPFLEEIAVRGFDSLQVAMDDFLNVKKRELRHTSYRTYKSKNTILFDWLKENNLEQLHCISFTPSHALNFSRWLYDERQLSNRTFNNYIKHFDQTFEWLISNEYLTINPFSNIKMKAKEAKERIEIDGYHRRRILEYFKKSDQNMYMVSLMVYYTLLRPVEIMQLKPSNFNLKNQTISVSSAMSKTNTQRVCTIPDVMLAELKLWNFNQAKANQYIFGPQFLPADTHWDPREFSRKWAYMRDDIKIPKKMQLYSLRDTGIIQLLSDGVAPQEVMRQAGHSSLDMTTVYLKHANPKGSEQIKKKASSFRGK